MAISVNKHAMRIVKEILSRRDELQVRVEKRPKGATIIDAGVNAPGGYEAGLMAVKPASIPLSINLSKSLIPI